MMGDWQVQVQVRFCAAKDAALEPFQLAVAAMQASGSV